MFGEYLYVYILRGIIMNKKYPIPTMEEPDEEQLEEWVYDSVCDATDGCTVEPDGVCPHGYPSWLLYLGLI
jgi:hypothetical protein